jgi:hypothetical protein
MQRIETIELMPDWHLTCDTCASTFESPATFPWPCPNCENGTLRASDEQQAFDVLSHEGSDLERAAIREVSEVQKRENPPCSGHS